MITTCVNLLWKNTVATWPNSSSVLGHIISTSTVSRGWRWCCEYNNTINRNAAYNVSSCPLLLTLKSVLAHEVEFVLTILMTGLRKRLKAIFSWYIAFINGYMFSISGGYDALVGRNGMDPERDCMDWLYELHIAYRLCLCIHWFNTGNEACQVFGQVPKNVVRAGPWLLADTHTSQ